MTNQQYTQIESLRAQGKSYPQISAALGIPVGTIKACCRRQMARENLCRNCGKPLIQTAKRKRKRFCGEPCRMAWWKSNRDQINKQAYYRIPCQHCGHCFDSYGNKQRKYCCHRCYIRERFGGEK